MNNVNIKEASQQEQKQLEEAIEQALNFASKKVDSAEISMNKATGISVSTLLGETENIEFNRDGRLGITVYQDNKTGHASTNDLSPQAIEQTIDMAIEIMKYTSPDPCSGLADKSQMAFEYPDLDLFYPSELTVEEAIKQAAEAESIALEYPEIKNSEGANFNRHYNIRVYGNTQGVLASYKNSVHSLSCSVIAERDGEMESNYAYTASRDIDSLQPAKKIGLEAAQKAVSNLGAASINTMKTPVLFSADIATGLLGHLASAIMGGAIYKKNSFLLDKIGTAILPDWLTISENPHQLKRMGSAPFDSEGVLTVDKTIIENGILKTYLLSSYSARKLSTADCQLKSTGNAGGIYNWQLSSEHIMPNFEQLLKMMGKGVLVTSLMGQGVNLMTGNYSRGAQGFWVENGVIQYPIHEFTIAGNLHDIYQNIVAIGSDTELRTRIQSGSILIDNMSIAGR